MMIDLHTHTVFSDGVLVPAELSRRAAVAGYQALAITDHADDSNLEFIINSIQQVTSKYSPYMGIDLVCGVELTHVPPALIAGLVSRARAAGAQLVLVHGQTITEPVETGTNLAAIEAGVDILAHPGLITPQEVALAAEKNVALEITTRNGHSLGNGHLARLATKYQAKLVINNDAHAPSDLVAKERYKATALGAGLSLEQFQLCLNNSQQILQKIFQK